MALAGNRPTPVCRYSCARANFSLGFPTPTGARSRRARDRGALGGAGGCSNVRRVGGTRNLAPTHFLSTAGGRSAITFACGGRRLFLRVERPGTLLGFGRWCASAGAGRLELSAAPGRGGAAGRLHRFLRARPRLPRRRRQGNCPAWRFLWRVDHGRFGWAIQGRAWQQRLVAGVARW